MTDSESAEAWIARQIVWERRLRDLATAAEEALAASEVPDPARSPLPAPVSRPGTAYQVAARIVRAAGLGMKALLAVLSHRSLATSSGP